MPVNKSPLRIAVCFSSEIRTFNNGVAEYWQQFVSDLKELDENIDVDFYGHTWDDCETPVGLDFKKIQFDTASDVIYKWVLEKPFLRGYLTQEDIHSPLNFDNVFYNTKRAIGQHVSGIKSLLLPDLEYDLYIKARWDSYLIPDISTEKPITSNLQKGINKFLTRYHHPAVFYPENRFGLINDVIIVFNRKSVRLIKERGLDYFMEIMEKNNGEIKRITPSFTSHSNWEYALTPNHYPGLQRDHYPNKDTFYLEKLRRADE